MSALLHNVLFPDRSSLLGRKWFKDPGTFNVAAPAGCTHIRASMVASGGQGEDPGGNGAFAVRKVAVAPLEVFQLQVGETATSGNPGHSWLRRVSTGEVVCFADRGRGTGQVQGNAAYCTGDVVEGGVAGVRSGGDLTDPHRLGFGGRYAAGQAVRAAGPGGGGRGRDFPHLAVETAAGCGCVVVEFFAGDPGY